MNRSACLALFALALAAPMARATPVLIAAAHIDSHGHDLSAATSAALENGTAGNELGGLGSGLAWAGGDTFLALPDRGPNAMPYNPVVDNTTSYIPRFQTLRMTLALAPAGSELPYTLTSQLTATTLLSSATPLAYGPATPALNSDGRFYFSGRSDNFAAGQPSDDAADARLDPEGLRVSNDGRSVYISDEYGPHLYVFDRATGVRQAVEALPAMLGVAKPAATEEVELSANPKGRMANKGMEGLALTPDGKTLVGILQSPLMQDGDKSGGFTRIVTLDLATGVTHQYAYPLSNIGSAAKPKYSGVSEIVAINDHEFLVDERDGTGLGDDKATPPGTTAVFKRLFHVDLAGGADVSATEGAGNLAPLAVKKDLFADLVAIFGAGGVAAADISAKIEGLAFGGDVTIGGMAQHTLWIATDNDFLADLKGTDGKPVDNANQFYVLAIPAADLPGYQAQAFAAGQ